MLKLQKIISGGQSGADQGGLQAGKHLDLKTGGVAPPNFMTEYGSNPSLHDMYGLIEGEPDEKIYPKRTKKNVKNSDGTVWFGADDSKGARLTLNTVYSLKKPHLINPTPIEFADWLITNNIEIMNVAGNRESRNIGIGDRTKNIIIQGYKIALEKHRTIYVKFISW